MANRPGYSYRQGISRMRLFKRFPDDAEVQVWPVKVRW